MEIPIVGKANECCKKSPWKPISTAPKDGTLIDVWCGNDEFPSRHTDVSYREPTASEWWVHGSEDLATKYPDKMWICYVGGPLIGEQEPTHWMPLPDAPDA